MEQEVEVSVEDILMYSYEKSFNFVIQKCNERLDISKTSINCKVRKILYEDFIVKEKFYTSASLNDDNIFKIEMYSKGLEYIMRNTNVLEIKEEIFVAAYMLKRLIVAIYLKSLKKYKHKIETYLKDEFFFIHKESCRNWFNHTTYADQYRRSIKEFVKKIKSYINDKKKLAGYLKDTIKDDFDVNYWDTLNYLANKIYSYVKSKLPKLVLEAISNINKTKIETEHGNKKQNEIVSFVFQQNLISEEKLLALLSTIPEKLIDNSYKNSNSLNTSYHNKDLCENTNLMPELVSPHQFNKLNKFPCVDDFAITKKSRIPLNEDYNQIYKMHVDEKNNLCEFTSIADIALMNYSCTESVPFFLSKDSNKEDEPEDVINHVYSYYCQFLPDNEEYFSESDLDDCDQDIDFGDHVDLMHFPNFRTYDC